MRSEWGHCEWLALCDEVVCIFQCTRIQVITELQNASTVHGTGFFFLLFSNRPFALLAVTQ